MQSKEQGYMSSNRTRPCMLNKNTSLQLFDLLRLQLNSLPINKYPLPLIRLRHSPLPNPRRKLIHHLLLRSLQQYPRRLRYACFHPQRNTELNRMGVADFERDELLARILWLDGDG